MTRRAASVPGQCKDCPAGSRRRPVARPGPRCATHQRARRAALKEAAWTRWILGTYHLTPERYYAILRVQGGKCYLCRRANGSRKKLAVDHDHKCCKGKTSCGKCVRGLLCSMCNNIFGHLRDDPQAFERGTEYLRDWPSRQIPEEEP